MILDDSNTENVEFVLPFPYVQYFPWFVIYFGAIDPRRNYASSSVSDNPKGRAAGR
jgi:hypothetical protein